MANLQKALPDGRELDPTDSETPVMLADLRRRSRTLLTLFLTVGLLASGFPLQGQEDDDLGAGLRAQYRSGAKVIERIEAVPHLQASAGEVVLEGCRPSDLEVIWRGQLLIRDEDVRFHFWLQGEMELLLDGKSIYAGSRTEPGWLSSDRREVSPGLADLEIRFRQSEPAAVFRMFWSSSSFPLEPLPFGQLFHTGTVEGATAGAATQGDESDRAWDQGRQLFTAHRCDRCHAVDEEPHSPPAKALWGVSVGLNPAWLKQKLLDQHVLGPGARMPHFGFDEAEAEAIAAYLIRLGSPFELASVPEVKVDRKNPGPTGEELAHTLGCLACHRIGEMGGGGPFSGPELTRIGHKRSAEWISTYLLRPERVNPQHQMPTFKLSPTERGLLVQYLASLGRTEETVHIDESYPAGSSQLVDRGRDLVKKFRCANCHKLPAIEADRRGMPTLRDAVPLRERPGCLGEQPDKSTGQPIFPATAIPALQSYLNSLTETAPAPLAQWEQGRREFEQRNCSSCHPRNGAGGLASTAVSVAQQLAGWQGEIHTLLPPHLTAVGDKLQDEVLQQAVAGDQNRLRLNWLKVQMPKFAETPRERALLAGYLRAADRLPADAPDEFSQAAQRALLTATVARQENSSLTLIHGRQLIGAGAFSCIACHQVGEYVPRNTAPGTRGSDLLQSGARLRPEFYFRWTHSPLRIIPGMEMPAYQRAVPGLLDDNVLLQLATLWTALESPDFTPPANPTQVEQLLIVDRQGPARVVRDVFQLTDGPAAGFVARAFAVGFPNGYAVLFDLDQATVREWTYGDFAKQFTEGKSWFWSLAGLAVPERAEEQWLVRQGGEERPLFGSESQRGVTQLQHYEIHPGEGEQAAISLTYSLRLADAPDAGEIVLTEHWRPLEQGWLRQISRGEGASDHELILLQTGGAERGSVARYVLPSGGQLAVEYESRLTGYQPLPPVIPRSLTEAGPVTTVPGYRGQRLPLPAQIMPTALAVAPDGSLLLTSLKGHVYAVRLEAARGEPLEVSLIEEGLAAPFGLLVDGADLLVAHKPEILRLREVFGPEGIRSPRSRESFISGWGYNENYHDWTTGPVRDRAGNLYIALGSDYSQPKRPEADQRWRGTILMREPNGHLAPIAREFRYPIGIALDARDRLFVTDQQGEQNTYNELNLVLPGRRYGVPTREDLRGERSGFVEAAPEGSGKMVPAVQIPHPWTRSVNGLFFLPTDGAYADHPFAGHGIGMEYNGRFLTRFTLQDVGGEPQGAVYPFSRIPAETDPDAFLGPICGLAHPNGDLFIGSIRDSGWLGGLNVGEIVQLSREQSAFPQGLREMRLVPGGFELEFMQPLAESERAELAARLSLQGATRQWGGTYATEDSGRYSPVVTAREFDTRGKILRLQVEDLRPGFVYELRLPSRLSSGTACFPDYAAYTIRQLFQ